MKIPESHLKLKKYPAYKDSGVEWIGEIPDGWEVKRLGQILSVSSIKNRPYLQLLSITREKGVIERDMENQEENHNFIPEDLSGYKVLKKGQFGMNKMKAWQGSYGVSNYHGIVSPAYYVFKISEVLIADFFHTAIRSKIYVSFFGQASDGVRIGQWDLSKSRMKNIPIILPPIPEQTVIANFLDEKCGKIDRAVAQKEKLVELLKERKQIVIQNAVTKGLNPNAKMKDSGVEWIGQIPEHWDVKKCKYLFFEADERSLDGQEELLSVSHMTGVTPRSEKDVNMFLAENYAGSKLCQKGDLVYNIMWAWMGALGVANQAGIVSPSYGVYRQKNQDHFSSVYLEELLKSKKYIEHYNKVSTGLHSSRLRFYSHMFFNMKIGFPSKSEQDEIVNHIEKESCKIDKAIALQQQLIEKLKEYKATLINSAVTGKIKVG